MGHESFRIHQNAGSENHTFATTQLGYNDALPLAMNLFTLVSEKVYRSWYVLDLGYTDSNAGSGCGE